MWPDVTAGKKEKNHTKKQNNRFIQNLFHLMKQTFWFPPPKKKVTRNLHERTSHGKAKCAKMCVI